MSFYVLYADIVCFFHRSEMSTGQIMIQISFDTIQLHLTPFLFGLYYVILIPVDLPLDFSLNLAIKLHIVQYLFLFLTFAIWCTFTCSLFLNNFTQVFPRFLNESNEEVVMVRWFRRS